MCAGDDDFAERRANEIEALAAVYSGDGEFEAIMEPDVRIVIRVKLDDTTAVLTAALPPSYPAACPIIDVSCVALNRESLAKLAGSLNELAVEAAAEHGGREVLMDLAVLLQETGLSLLKEQTNTDDTVRAVDDAPSAPSASVREDPPDGPSRPCCLPECDSPSGSGELVCMSCTNAKCSVQPVFMHRECFERKERELEAVVGKRGGGKRKDEHRPARHGDLEGKHAVWTIAYHMVRTGCRCRCSKGYFCAEFDVVPGAKSAGSLRLARFGPDGALIPQTPDAAATKSIEHRDSQGKVAALTSQMAQLKAKDPGVCTCRCGKVLKTESEQKKHFKQFGHKPVGAKCPPPREGEPLRKPAPERPSLSSFVTSDSLQQLIAEAPEEEGTSADASAPATEVAIE